MSRQIEFRAWHNRKNEWLHDSKPPSGGCSILGETIWAFGEWCRVSIDELNDIVIEQFTGIKDENGAEIYEGDIVELWNSHNDESEFHEIGQVKWMDDFAGFGVAHKAGTHLSWTQYEIDVLGNIHDNPDLLK